MADPNTTTTFGPAFWASASTAVILLGGVIKGSRGLGRIEEGVKGLYGRAKRLESWQDDHDKRLNQRSERR